MAGPPTFIVNPASGGGRTGGRWRQWEAEAIRLMPGSRVEFTAAAFDAARIATEAVLAGSRLIVAVGGDGTVNEVVNGMMAAGLQREEAALGILPCGTGSDLARGLGIPAEMGASLTLLAAGAAGAARPIDIGRLRGVSLGASGAAVVRHFVNEADFGLGAEVTRRIHARARRGGRATYLWTTVRALLRWQNPEVLLRVDGGPLEACKIKSVFLANAPYAGGGMCIAPGARPDDGRLRLVIYGDLGRLEAIRRLGETYEGREIEHPCIRYADCTELLAESADEVLVECDGEPVGRLPARFDLVPAALRVIAGPG